MKKSNFRFKQFSIEHGIDTLKVCTESCILGAIAQVEASNYILDIGTGSGLIAIMVAQRSKASITGVEILSPAFEQAMKNFSNSPWADQLKAVNSSINDFEIENSASYDTIISNPPFYKDHQPGLKPIDNHTKHEVNLSQSELIKNIERLLSNDGCAYVLYPPYEMQNFISLTSTSALSLKRMITIRNYAGHKTFREIAVLHKNKGNSDIQQELVIYNQDKSYTQEFIDLLNPYYLYL